MFAFIKGFKRALGWVDNSPAMTSGNDVEQIIDAVLTVTGVTKSELLSRRRSSNYVRARHIAIHLLTEMTDLSYVQIGRVMNRDHTMAAYVKEKMSGRGRGASQLNRELAEIKRKLAS